MVECNFERHKVADPMSQHGGIIFVKRTGDLDPSERIFCAISNHSECDEEDCIHQQQLKLLKEIANRLDEEQLAEFYKFKTEKYQAMMAKLEEVMKSEEK